jgi:bisphosphoglycerate-independent phosphoglycerate mutase (AlkP superfamily)
MAEAIASGERPVRRHPRVTSALDTAGDFMDKISPGQWKQVRDRYYNMPRQP